MQLNSLNVSRETQEKLEIYIAELIKWNDKINLISRSTSPQEIIERHILDCAQLKDFIPNKKSIIYDIGTGAGLPGLVLSILGYEQIILVEIHTKKGAFLHHIINKLNLPCTLINDDVNKLDSSFPKADYITSRAFASIETIVNSTLNITQPNTCYLFLKSLEQASEVEVIRANWYLELKIHQNQYRNEGAIFEIFNLKKK
jgi:16S rRNA (guanine(527)-N(7))-methyltransferase RsmG